MPLTPLAKTRCRGRIVHSVPSSRFRRAVQHRAVLVVGGADELGAGPEIDLHRAGVILEPVREHVLGNVLRPRRRKGHVGQVIDVDLVVQRQRMIALAPVVADPLPAIDDQRVDVELAEPGRDRKARLAAADHEDGGVAVGVGLALAALIEPVVAAEIARVGLARWPALADVLLETFQLLERGEEHPGPDRIAASPRVVRNQPNDAVAAAKHRLELEDGLDHVDAETPRATGRRTPRRQAKAVRVDLRLAGREQAGELSRTPRGREDSR